MKKNHSAKKWVTLRYNPVSGNFWCNHVPRLYRLAMLDCLKFNKNGIFCMVLPYNYALEFVQNWQKNKKIPVSICTPICVVQKMVDDSPFDACQFEWEIIFVNKNYIFRKPCPQGYDKAVYETANNISEGKLCFLSRADTTSILEDAFHKD